MNRYIHALGAPENRRDAVTQFTENSNRLISLKIPVDPPYFKCPKSDLNDLGLPSKNYYTTQEVCKVLRVKPDTFRDRLCKGYYPDSGIKVSGGGRFTLAEIREIIKLTEELRNKGNSGPK